MIENPILKGFNPDPSIIRVDDDYYIATSTFEWFPGVQIHHSRDLKNWQLISRPLNRLTQLDLKGCPDSCGVWAPCLSYDNGIFYLVYSNVHSFDGVWKDTPNYLVTASDINGPWSEPVYLSSRGFDGSLFHDANGKKWFLNMLVDHRKGKFFGGIEMQEYSPKLERLIGKAHFLTNGSSLGLSEGPHVFQKDGFYYLILAEGGTEYNHALSVARSKTIFGPYEYHPDNPVITTKDNPENKLQKSGHGDFVQTQDGDWYSVFLVGRPLSALGRCTLGRETGIEEIIWRDKWPYLKNGTKVPNSKVPTPKLATHEFALQEHKMYFNNATLDIHFQSLRIPITEHWCSLSKRKGFLRLYGKESLNSTHNQSLLARRIQSFNVEVNTKVEFHPNIFQQMAGLVFYYNTGHYHYACITADYSGEKKFLSIFSMDNYAQISQEELVDVTAFKAVIIKGIMRNDILQFYFSTKEGEVALKLGTALDASILSDDYVQKGSNRYRPAFTGSFVGMCCQDLAYNKLHADFEWFDYKEIS